MKGWFLEFFPICFSASRRIKSCKSCPSEWVRENIKLYLQWRKSTIKQIEIHSKKYFLNLDASRDQVLRVMDSLNWTNHSTSIEIIILIHNPTISSQTCSWKPTYLKSQCWAKSRIKPKKRRDDCLHFTSASTRNGTRENREACALEHFFNCMKGFCKQTWVNCDWWEHS